MQRLLGMRLPTSSWTTTDCCRMTAELGLEIGTRYVRNLCNYTQESSNCSLVNHSAGLLRPVHRCPVPGYHRNSENWASNVPVDNYFTLGGCHACTAFSNDFVHSTDVSIVFRFCPVLGVFDPTAHAPRRS